MNLCQVTSLCLSPLCRYFPLRKWCKRRVMFSFIPIVASNLPPDFFLWRCLSACNACSDAEYVTRYQLAIFVFLPHPVPLCFIDIYISSDALFLLLSPSFVVVFALFVFLVLCLPAPLCFCLFMSFFVPLTFLLFVSLNSQEEDSRAQADYLLPPGSRARFKGISGYGFVRDSKDRLYTVYTLEMKCDRSGAEWAVYRRYQDFANLNDKVSDRLSSGNVSTLTRQLSCNRKIYNGHGWREKQQNDCDCYRRSLFVNTNRRATAQVARTRQQSKQKQ